MFYILELKHIIFSLRKITNHFWDKNRRRVNVIASENGFYLLWCHKMGLELGCLAILVVKGLLLAAAQAVRLFFQAFDVFLHKRPLGLF